MDLLISAPSQTALTVIFSSGFLARSAKKALTTLRRVFATRLSTAGVLTLALPRLSGRYYLLE